GISKVEFWYASIGEKIGEDDSAPYSISWDTSSTINPVSDGNHNLWAVAYDKAGNASSSELIPVVVDNTAPVLTLPPDITQEAVSSSGAAVDYTASANDAIDGPVDITCSPVSGLTFSMGTTTVECSAKDSQNNLSSGEFKIIVVDTTAPVLTLPLPEDVTKEATGPSGAVVDYEVSALDIVSGSVTTTCALPSGSTFPITTTSVFCSATDAAANTKNESFNVTVQDTTGPEIQPSLPIIASATGPGGAIITYTTPSATDLVDGSRPVSCDPASDSTFIIGTTLVTCTSSDSRGNTSSQGFNVTVSDTSAPTLSLPSEITEEATGPGGAVINFTASAVDDVDSSVNVICTPVSGSTFQIGTTNVSCSATDSASNTATGNFNVIVKDTIEPSVPELSSPASGSEFNYNPTLSWLDSTDTGSGIRDYLVGLFSSSSIESLLPGFPISVTSTSYDASSSPSLSEFR
ncbi:HYR domain-containing protein, partial [Candidatus Wolfebacteria bacterium]|nr:HYR domain-containing protein [Candidatus Wolfebacteria bacterium]